MIKKELSVFLIVGTSTVIIDYTFYQSIIALQWATIDSAKAFSFMIGTIFAYIANRFWTFNHKETSNNSVLKFTLLYSAALFANVFINSLLLKSLGKADHILRLAFFCATGISAAMNFIGMKFIVFQPPKEIEVS